jgi:ABC-type multidrug transport system fused ATPase/permease subunit
VDRILVFHEGEIIQEGKYDELAEQDGLFRELLEGPVEEKAEFEE